ncbi:MAG: DMT family transporter [Pseudomonadota bacterium]
MHPVLLTAIAMAAFAANSLLCRMALGSGSIDPASFTLIRLFSGALVLALLLRPHWRELGLTLLWPISWPSTLSLFTYMVCFSFAYLSLETGTGALLLFGAVQLTMFAVALQGGERFNRWASLGLAMAAGGLVYLVAPGVTAPEPQGAILMALAGVAWGVYSLLGRGAKDPLVATGASFITALPFAALVSVAFLADQNISYSGFGLAVASGAVASALGYVVWYAALRHLTAARAATVQLSVPALAALGGVVLLSEPLSLRLVLASTLTLGGVALVLYQRSQRAAP